MTILDTLLVTATKTAPPVRHVRPFLKGPVDWAWLQAAMALEGQALAVGVALWQLAGLTGSHTVRLGYRRLPFSRWTTARGLAALESAGLVTVKRRRGRLPMVSLPPDIVAWVKR